MLKINEILLEVKNEATEWNKMKSQFTIENGMVKLWHYSSHKISDGVIKIGGKQNLHSRGEYQAWGRSRAFFYATEDGVNYDKGVPNTYLYICHIPVTEIYPIDINPNEYQEQKNKVSWESYYEQATEDGYTAFAYYLNKNKNVPIIITFKALKIDKAYAKSTYGDSYMPLGEKSKDYAIGQVNIDGDNWFIIQRNNLSPDMLNTYLSQSKKGGEYQKPFDQYQWKLAKIYPEYQKDYKIKQK